MRRIAAILLLGILFFNWYGYQVVSAYLQNRADRRLEAVLDANSYDGSQLISLKVPVNSLSYYNSSTQFERVDGQIEVGGVQYKYVKRRLYGDSLELLCIPNRTAMKLQTAKNDFFRQVNDLQPNGQNGKKQNTPVSKSFSTSDYTITGDLLVIGQPGFIDLPASYMQDPVLPSSYIGTDEQPPNILT